MSKEHDTAIPAETLTEVEELLKEILLKLEPYRTPMTAEERREMTTVGDKTLAFLEKGKEYIDLYPELVPAWLDKNDFAVDFEDLRNVISLKNLVDQAQETIYNIHYIAGSEAFQWMRDYYQAARQAAARNIPNAKIITDDMGKRFRRPRRSNGTGDKK